MAFEDLSQNVELYNCDRCGFSAHIGELIEDPASPGMLVHPKCADVVGFNEERADNPKNNYGTNYFLT